MIFQQLMVAIALLLAPSGSSATPGGNYVPVAPSDQNPATSYRGVTLRAEPAGTHRFQVWVWARDSPSIFDGRGLLDDYTLSAE